MTPKKMLVRIALVAFASFASQGTFAQDAKAFFEKRFPQLVPTLQCDWNNPARGDLILLCQSQDKAKKVLLGTAPGNVKNVPLLKQLGDNLLMYRAGNSGVLQGKLNCQDEKEFLSFENAVAAGGCSLTLTNSTDSGLALNFQTVFMKTPEMGDAKVFISMMNVQEATSPDELKSALKAALHSKNMASPTEGPK